MWAYITRRLVYNVPVYLCILLLMMLALRVRDPVYGRLSKNPTKAEIAEKRAELGVDRPFIQQYGSLLRQVVTMNFDDESWNYSGQSVGEVLGRSVGPSVAITLPALLLTTIFSITVALISAWFRGRPIDRTLVIASVLGMSVSFLAYIIIGQYFGAYRMSEWLGTEIFAIHGYEVTSETTWTEYATQVWPRFCLLPVIISVIVAMGYDTRFYRAVMVEESGKDYITTAVAKGASRPKIMFVHMLKNAMIPIITRVVITIPFLITGSFLLERYFGIPGMGNELITAVQSSDFPIVQAFTAVFAAVYIASNLLTDVLYALVDPRVRLS